MEDVRKNWSFKVEKFGFRGKVKIFMSLNLKGEPGLEGGFPRNL